MNITVKFDASPAILRLFSRNQSDQEAIMASLAEIVEATRQSGEAARAAIGRVAEDLMALQDQIDVLQRQVAAGVTSAAELQTLKTGLDAVATDLGSMTADLQGLDPVPGTPAPTP